MKPTKTNQQRINFMKQNAFKAITAQPFNLTWTNTTGAVANYVVFDAAGICGQLAGWLVNGVMQPPYVAMLPSGGNPYVLLMTRFLGFQIEALSIQSESIAQAVQSCTYYKANLDGSVDSIGIDTATQLRNDQFNPNIMDFQLPVFFDIATALVITVLPGETMTLVFFPPDTYSTYLKANQKWPQWTKPM